MKKVKLISSSETYPLRLAILWSHLKNEEDCRIDVDELEGTFHVGAYKDEELVAVGTFLIESNKQLKEKKQYRLRAMATSTKVRGEGFGKQIIDFAVEELKQRKMEILWCDARKIALGFYEKMDFTIIGDYYDVPKIGPHKLMYKLI